MTGLSPDNFDSSLFFPLQVGEIKNHIDLSKMHIADAENTHPYSDIAKSELQVYLNANFRYDEFGLSPKSKTFGKMFGVLTVQNQKGEIGYLRAFSGKLHQSNHHAGFVPSIFDGMQPDGFLTKGMTEITAINMNLTMMGDGFEKEEILAYRKLHSQRLQDQIIEQYFFLNSKKESKSLTTVFDEANRGKPPGGAGECAAPKLLQYAHQHSLMPIALNEFYWGAHSRSKRWTHKESYTPCNEKCAPILKHMLS